MRRPGVEPGPPPVTLRWSIHGLALIGVLVALVGLITSPTPAISSRNPPNNLTIVFVE